MKTLIFPVRISNLDLCPVFDPRRPLNPTSKKDQSSSYLCFEDKDFLTSLTNRLLCILSLPPLRPLYLVTLRV